MTELLEASYHRDSQTTRPQQQIAIASRILAELADEQEWSTRINATTDQQWDRLSELARQEVSARDTDTVDDVLPS